MKKDVFKIKLLLFIIISVIAANVFLVFADELGGDEPLNTYTVWFNAGNGDATVSQNVIEGEYALKPHDPRWNYRKFECWTLDGERFSFETPITGNIELKALWSLVEYNITYAEDLIDIDDFPTKFKLNDVVQLPAIDKPGYNFLNWHARMGTKNFDFYDKDKTLEDPSLEYKKYLLTDEPADCFISASFNPYLYKIKYEPNATNYIGSMTMEKNRSYGSKYRFKACGYSRVGYQFIGWNTLENPVKDENAPASLRGIWFDDNGDYSSADFMDQNLNFKEGSGREGEKFVDNDTITLYAQWELVEYDISFYLDKGYFDESETGEPFIINGIATHTVPETFTIDQTITIPTPIKGGYNFIEWRDKKAAGTVLPNVIPKGTDISKAYYAMWKAKEYTIQFDANTGTGEMNSLPVVFSVSYKLPNNKFSKRGYVFDGWNTVKNPSIENPGRHYDDNTDITPATDWEGIVKLYAQWKVVDYSVKYVLDGGYFKSSVKPQAVDSYNVESEDIYIPDPTRNGYDFVLWREGSDTSVSCNYIKKGSIGNKTFYADWSPITYSITLFSNMDDSKTGTDKEPVKKLFCTYGQSYMLPEKAFERKGYAFVGWTYNRSSYPIKFEEGDTVRNLTSTQDYDVKLYALWEKLPNGEVIKGEDYTIMNVGCSKEFGLDYLKEKGIVLSKGSTPSWISSKPGVVSVDSNGKLTALNVGTAVISISAYDVIFYPELDYKIIVNVKKPTLTVDKKSLTLYIDDKGDTDPSNDFFEKYTLNVRTNGETMVPTFSTSDIRVAIVDKEKGVISAISEGECTITIEANGLTCYCDVQVVKVGIKSTINYLELSTKKDQNIYYIVPKVDGKSKKIKWKSYDSKICTVSNGRIVAKRPGETIVSAEANGRTTLISIKVVDTDILLKSPELYVTPVTTEDKPIYLNTKGINTSCIFTPMFSGKTNKIVWKSSDTKVASVSNGKVIGRNTGDAVITASANGLTVSRHVHVEKTTSKFELPKYMINADLNPSLNLRTGLYITGIDTKKENVIWKTSNNTIAEVSNGMNGGIVTPLRQGTVRIYATINGITTSTMVNITKSTIVLSKTYLKLDPSNKRKNRAVLKASITGIERKAKFTSSNPDIVSVKNGTITALKQGYAIITAEANGKKATCMVLSVVDTQ